jgi:hypothetical protein
MEPVFGTAGFTELVCNLSKKFPDGQHCQIVVYFPPSRGIPGRQGPFSATVRRMGGE